MSSGRISVEQFGRNRGLRTGHNKPVDSSKTSPTVNPTNSALSTNLPGKVLSRLEPQLRELYSQLPTTVASRISALVRAEGARLLDPNRVGEILCIFVRDRGSGKAQRAMQFRKIMRDARNAKWLARYMGSMVGIKTRRRQHGDTASAAAPGNKSRLPSMLCWDSCKCSSKSPRSIAPSYPCMYKHDFPIRPLRKVGKMLHHMRIATVLDEEDLTSEKDGEANRRAAIAQTYIWWRLIVAPYPKKWSDMHQLARAWRMSPSLSVKDFQTVVMRISKGAIPASAFGSLWDSVLSKKL